MATAIARWIKPVCFPNLGFHRLFSCRSCRMLTLNRNIHKSFGSSSECLWNVMQKWLADLWHSSITRKENEPARRSISFSLRFSYWFLTFGIHFKGRKIICWVAWWHPAFLISRILPPRTPRNTAKSKDYWVAQKFDHLIAVFPPKALLSVRCLWLAVFLPMCRAVTARVALFLPDSERCTMNRVYRLIGPM